jgi:four helix bundle protein
MTPKAVRRFSSFRRQGHYVVMGDFKKLDVWQAAHSLACDVYRNTGSFPKTEAYGLTSQLRRSAASIPANIAEGCGRNGDVEFRRFVQISLGSATELEYHLLLSRDIGLLDVSTHTLLSDQVRRIQGMLAGLRRALRPRISPSRKAIANSQ